ncbi:phosphonate degradation HD-domain oxygenase [uncultured Limnohabitans sp.]|jgi:phosphonate degradation associated HDIG domain protein|uniref:phosphonate degradation HD-domain oxygenase n=1 Tax=uncultured Limnohabitans sp. TaxID=768543 RepID=UPI0026162B6E|nr:phosphonate degradation HD-domain oxygenase [uncultured Limnohabitans sp.]
MPLMLSEVLDLLEQKGQSQYGMEAVSQLAHALQCAHLAEQAGETPETVVAALLHDLGHLLVSKRAGVQDQSTQQDDLHQYIALPFLRGLFPDAVLEPIRLHVDAKRYLCLMEPSYWASLSPASQNSLLKQGGIFSETEAEAFISQPFASESVRLRRYDDLAKDPAKIAPDLSHYKELLQQVAH